MIAVLKSVGNNHASIINALRRLRCEFKLTSSPSDLIEADRIIIPGVGCAKVAMHNLKTLNLIEIIKALTKPVLGICLGMQLLYKFSEEENIDCLGIFDGVVKKLSGSLEYPIPHMGWNNLNSLRNNKILADITPNSYCYFVHSYYAAVSDETLASTNYCAPISAIVNKDNFFGMQFHPEKSGKVGATLLENFLRLT